VRYRYRVGALLFLLAVITYLDRVCISVAGPRIQEYLRIGPQQWGWVVGVFAIAYAVFEIPGGWMADRFGPRITLTRIVLWWSAFTGLTGAVSSYPFLLLTRFWFGAGEAGAFPNAAASIASWFPASERGRAFGFLSMAMQTGGAVSPFLVRSDSDALRLASILLHLRSGGCGLGSRLVLLVPKHPSGKARRHPIRA
jgi:MFS transporter, ACS family, glucarate transporter